MMWWPFGAVMGWGMVVWMVIFWGGIIALIVWGIKKLSGRDNYPSNRSSLDIARERYARGEITREEFEQLRKDLS